MSRELYILVFLLCIVTCYSDDNFKFKETKYLFNNYIIANNEASNKVLSKWSFSGKLTIQDFSDYKVFKLDKIKTTIFNGQKSNESDAIEKEITVENEIILMPFVLYSNGLIDVNISVVPDDKMWSINMKKAIASVFNIDPNLNSDFNDTEQLVWSQCNVDFEVINFDKSKIITKYYDFDNCSDIYETRFRNTEWANVNNNHNTFQYATIRTYVINNKNYEISSAESSTNITFQTSPDELSYHNILQYQKYVLINSSSDFKPINISDNTIVKTIRYEADDSNDDNTNKTQKEYINLFKESYEQFETMMNEKPLSHLDFKKWNNTINDMFNSLTEMDSKSLTLLSIGLFLMNNEQQIHTFLSLIPYVGTNHTIHLIKELVENDVLNDLLLIKLLATLPEYVTANEELLKECETFLSLPVKKVKNKYVRNTAYLTFASLVAEGFQDETINETLADKYLDKVYDKYLRSVKYENEFNIVLALINMAYVMDEGTIMNILDNPNESRHIKALAMYGFRSRLADQADTLFNRFWPMVKNATEDFEVRVAALDMLLNSEISENQFNEIVNFYDKQHDDPFDKHLTNYIFSSIHSLQNTTGYYYHLGDWATARLKKGNIPEFPGTWTTGNYRIAFTDEKANFGVSLQLRLISDPITNNINVIILTFNHFAMTLNLETYHLYLKFEGVLDLTFIQNYLNDRPNDEIPISALLDLINQYKYKFKGFDDIFIDVALFCEDRAVFGMHINEDNYEKILENPLFRDLIKLSVNYNSVSFPIYNILDRVTDLGTYMNINYDMQQVIFHRIKNEKQLFDDEAIKSFTINEKMYTYMATILSLENPLINTNIAVFKVHYDLKTLDLPITLDTENYLVTWEHKNDSFNWVMDNLIATSVDNETILQEYCSKCPETEEIPIMDCIVSEIDLSQCQDDSFNWYSRFQFKILPLGVQLNVTRTKQSEEMKRLTNMKPNLNQQTIVFNTHRSNANAFPLAKPFLYYIHFIYYNRFLDNDLTRIGIRSFTIYEEPYKSELKLTSDFNDTVINDEPIDGTNLNVLFELAIRRLTDKHILSFINGTLNMQSLISSNHTESKKPQTENNQQLTVDILQGDNIKTKFCLRSHMMYPERNSDKFSLTPVTEAKGITTISYGKVNSFEDECVPYNIKITQISKATEEQNRKAIESQEYKTCKSDSVDYKYVPPTKACIKAHSAISLYNKYTIYLEFLHGGEKPSVEAQNINELENSKIFEYYHNANGHINISLHSFILRQFEIYSENKWINHVETSSFGDIFSIDPTSVAYDEWDVELGLSNTCDITPHTLKTFTKQYKIPFEKESSETILAFVECFNETRSGLTVTKINNKLITFKYWSGDNVILTEIKDGKLKVTMNGKEKLRTDQISQNPDEPKIYFFEDNVIYIGNTIADIYYTTESISIKALSIFNNYICGQCSYKDEYLEI